MKEFASDTAMSSSNLFLPAVCHDDIACCASNIPRSLQVFGVYADYYIFETTVKEQPEDEEEKLGQCLLPACLRVTSSAVLRILYDL